MWWDSVLSAVASGGTSALFGGLTGLATTGIKAYSDYKNRRLDLEFQATKNAQELAMMDKTAEQMRLEADRAITIANVEAEKDRDHDDAQLRSQAIQATAVNLLPQSSVLPPAGDGFFARTAKGLVFIMFGVADWIKTMTRPMLTFYLLIFTSVVVTKFANMSAGASLAPTEAFRVWLNMVDSMIYLTVSAVQFWIGGRAIEKRWVNGKGR
jgi:hypothetical protein